MKHREERGHQQLWSALMVTQIMIVMVFCFGMQAMAGGAANGGRAFPNLVSFTATFADGSTYLNWKIKTEVSNCLYIIERSTNGKDWEMVGSKEGFGNPHVQVVLLYSYVDAGAPALVCTYRVHRIDQNGALPEYITPVRKVTPTGSQDLTRLSDLEH